MVDLVESIIYVVLIDVHYVRVGGLREECEAVPEKSDIFLRVADSGAKLDLI